MRSLAVAVLLLASIARADDTLDAGLTLADAMKDDKDGSQLDDHLAALKVHATELAKLHKDHKKDKAVSAKLDAAEKAAKDVLALGAQAKKAAKNKKLFAAADKKLKAKLATYSAAALAANKALDKKPEAAVVAPPTSEPAPVVATKSDGASVTSTTCKKIEFVPSAADGKLLVRAVLVDARRRQSRELAANNAPVTKADDYELSFMVKDRKADWKVVDESYEWRETSAKSGATLTASRKSSRDVAKNDTLEVGVGAGDAVRGKISATIAWKNGATEETDKEDCSFEVAVSR